jgi:oligosaccharyltransferase complex subunit beta
MRSLLSVAVLLFAAIVSAVSTAGDRLLVVADDVADTEAYGKFFEDLTSKLRRRIGRG